MNDVDVTIKAIHYFIFIRSIQNVLQVSGGQIQCTFFRTHHHFFIYASFCTLVMTTKNGGGPSGIYCNGPLNQGKYRGYKGDLHDVLALILKRERQRLYLRTAFCRCTRVGVGIRFIPQLVHRITDSAEKN